MKTGQLKCILIINFPIEKNSKLGWKVLSNDENVEKGLMMYAVEKSFLDLKEDALDKVTENLKNNFNCYLPDCLEKPEYLKKILDELYPDLSDMIIIKIKQKLAVFADHPNIKKFIDGLER